jgi:hypothetical protein
MQQDRGSLFSKLPVAREVCGSLSSSNSYKKSVLCTGGRVPVDMDLAGRAESAPRCTNPRTGKRQLYKRKRRETILGLGFPEAHTQAGRFYTNAFVQRSAQGFEGSS